MIYSQNPKRKYRHEERDIQISIFEWARLIKVSEGGSLFDYMTASPNGGHRHILEAVNFKKSGVSAGFPDVSILLPRNNFHGMFLEIKKLKVFSLTEKQKIWIERLNNVGYYAVFGFGFDFCKNLIEGYLGDRVLSDNRIQTLQGRKKDI